MSLISAAFISGERFYAIYWPLKHLTVSMRAYRIVIFVVWTLSILVSMVVFLAGVSVSNKHADYFLASYFVTLLFIVCCCNIGIRRKFQQGGIAPLQQQNRTFQKKRLTKTLLFVSVIAVLSWLPLLIVQYLDIMTVLPVTVNIVVFLCYSNSFLNPVMYALRIPEFKEALGFCCFRWQAAISTESNERSDNRAASSLPLSQLKTFSTLASHLTMAYEQDVMDTRL